MQIQSMVPLGYGKYSNREHLPYPLHHDAKPFFGGRVLGSVENWTWKLGLKNRTTFWSERQF